ncbi:MAG: LLM class F420-dependent oxidoreductase, partial [Candidatus Dormiibacterota bacterium]
DPSEVGMQGSVSWRDQRLSELEEEVRSWEAAGASHLSINTMGAQLRSVEDHLQVLGAVAGRLGLKESSADS